MTCRDFEELVRDLAANRATPSAASEAVQHSASCAHCAERLEQEQHFTTALRAIASEEVSVPPAIEGHLRAAFRESLAKPARVRRAGLATVGIWAAAALAAAVALLFVGLGRRHTAPPEVAAVQPNVEPEKPAQLTQSRQVPAEVPIRRVRTTSRSRRRPAADRTVVTDFFPLAYGAQLPSSGQIIRVKLPRSALLSFGVPVDAQALDQRVQADVLMGDDGLARAVRFVR